MKQISYIPEGTCSRLITVAADDNQILTDIAVVGGCNGNIKGLIALMKGQPLSAIRERLAGITCRDKATSCPDQISRAIDLLQQEY